MFLKGEKAVCGRRTDSASREHQMSNEIPIDSSTQSRPIISRVDAKAAGLIKYFLGTTCKRGHITERHVCNGTCVICQNERLADYSTTPRGRAGSIRRAARYSATPNGRLKQAQHEKTPEVKAIRARYAASPEGRAKRAARKITLDARMENLLRARLNRAIKDNFKAGSAVEDLGCTIDQFCNIYIAWLFKPGMTWDNWGLAGEVWHLDHRRPLSTFDLSNREQFQQAVHYTNYQPLWGSENISKGNRRIDPPGPILEEIIRLQEKSQDDAA